MVLDLETGDTVQVAAQGGTPTWSPTGHIVYSRRGGFLEAVPFDLDGMKPTGPPTTVLSGLFTFGDVGSFSISESGTLVYLAGAAPPIFGAGEDVPFMLIGLDGVKERLPATPTDHWDGSFSPDGRRIAYIRGGRVWIYDLDRGDDRALEGGPPSGEHYPVWSPDGRRIVFTSERAGGPGAGDLYIQTVPASDSAVFLTGTNGQDFATDWLEDGTILFFNRTPPTGDGFDDDIYAVQDDGNGQPVPVLSADWRENSPSVSPDGRWLSYLSSEGLSSESQVYVRTYPDLLSQTLVSDPSLGFVIEPTGAIWAPDRKSIYYQQANTLWAADYDDSEGFRIIARREVGPNLGAGWRIKAIDPSGTRFLSFTVPNVLEQARAPQLVVVVNWLAELRDRLGESSNR